MQTRKAVYTHGLAWHGPDDASLAAHAANLLLEVNSPNFGIHEWIGFSDQWREVFPGCPEVQNGYMYPNDPKHLLMNTRRDRRHEKALASLSGRACS